MYARSSGRNGYNSSNGDGALSKKNPDEAVYISYSIDTLGKGTIYQSLRSGRIWHKVNF